MAVSQIEEKILGRLARLTEPSNPLLSASLYQVLGLSVLLSKKLFRARKLRKLDITRDTKSLQLYHHIIWLAREGLSIVEVYILPCCQNGESGPECRVMAAKLRASFYHIFCLFHNHPPINASKSPPQSSESSPASDQTGKGNKGSSKRSSGKSLGHGRDGAGHRRRKSSKSGAGLRDPIPSMTSDASYVTNPFASPASPPPSGPPPPIPHEARKTPTHPPGLALVKIPSPQAAASFLLPPLNFVPMARDNFESAQQLAAELLPAAHSLRLSVSLEHAAFLWDCDKEHDSARRLARRTIKDVYASAEGLDDDEFADAAALVQALGGIVKRGSSESTPADKTSSPPYQGPVRQQSRRQSTIPRPSRSGVGPVDRTIAVSPAPSERSRSGSSASSANAASASQIPRSITRTSDRLSTVPEDPSQETSERETTAPTTLSPPISRLSSRSNPSKHLRPSRTSSATSAGSDKAAKRRAVEAAEELYYRRNSAKSAESWQATPSEGYVRKASPSSATAIAKASSR
jgi:hypothetical protein